MCISHDKIKNKFVFLSLKAWPMSSIMAVLSRLLPQTHADRTLITSSLALPDTNDYRPPEYSDSKFSVKSDVYSSGVVSIAKEGNF